MANYSRRQSGAVPPPISHGGSQQKPQAVPATESPQEPVMRRWPHPTRLDPIQCEDAFLRYVRCALSYQNQMLADIKTLLEQIQLNTARDDPDTEET